MPDTPLHEILGRGSDAERAAFYHWLGTEDRMNDTIKLLLSSAHMGDAADEDDFNRWAIFVGKNVTKSTGIHIAEVIPLRFGSAGEDQIVGANATQRDVLRRWLSVDGWEAFCASTPDEKSPRDDWPARIAIAACLRIIADDIAKGTGVDLFDPDWDSIQALAEDSGQREHDPRTEAGFRSWLNHYGGLASERIDAAVADLVWPARLAGERAELTELTRWCMTGFKSSQSIDDLTQFVAQMARCRKINHGDDRLNLFLDETMHVQRVLVDRLAREMGATEVLAPPPKDRAR